MANGPPRNRLEATWPWIVRFLGVGIAVYETVFENLDRPSLLMLAGAMILGPEYIRFQRSRNGSK